MNSNKGKLQYRFRVHNVEELESITKYIRRRKIGAMGDDCVWVEFTNFDSFMEWVNYQKYCDLMIRVYFNADFKRDKFRKQIERTLPIWKCGNHKCNDTKCKYFMYNNLETHRIEYSWRCILADEDYEYEEDF